MTVYVIYTTDDRDPDRDFVSAVRLSKEDALEVMNGYTIQDASGVEVYELDAMTNAQAKARQHGPASTLIARRNIRREVGGE